MMSLYLFCAALGIPLLALFALGGSDAEVDADLDVGDVGFDVGDAGFDGEVGTDIDVASHGDVGDFTGLWRKIPVSSYAFFLSFFGGVGAITTWITDSGTIPILIFSVVLGILAAAINAAFFGFLRRTDSSSQLTERQIEGRLATVSVPIEAGMRGRISLDTGEERLQLTARSVDGSVNRFDRGDEVVVVRVDNGVAHVMAVDPELT